MQKVILPPQCLGIMGGGQLGRMFAISAKQMGYKVAVLEPDKNCPAKHFADYHITTSYDNQKGLDQLAALSQVVTTEFENVPAQSLDYLATQVAVFPTAESILIAQNRLQEKAFFNNNGIATVAYQSIHSIHDLNSINPDIFPAILKTNTLGYDGKGQIRVTNHAELKQAFIKLNHVPCILEKMVDLKLEVSVIVARNSFETVTYPVVENIHTNGILDMTIAPARIDASLMQKVSQAASIIIERLDYIGVLAIEFFITQDGQFLANEMAPRPHNSGHFTLDACITSQFEQQVRSICNLKLGSTHLHSNAIMLNLLGNVWPESEIHPNWGLLLSEYNNLKLHLYDKLSAKAERKMGHLTILGDNLDSLLVEAQAIKSILNNLSGN